jgi:hypothetical protein
MLVSFAHRAVVDMPSGADDQALGASVTVAVCGSSDHVGPCPLAPHHTSVERAGEQVTVRVLFATEPENEARVRQLVESALETGSVVDPDGRVRIWRCVESGVAAVLASELVHGNRLASSPR